MRHFHDFIWYHNSCSLETLTKVHETNIKLCERLRGSPYKQAISLRLDVAGLGVYRRAQPGIWNQEVGDPRGDVGVQHRNLAAGGSSVILMAPPLFTPIETPNKTMYRGVPSK